MPIPFLFFLLTLSFLNSSYINYSVKKGDTLSQIASKHNISLKVIKEVNKKTNNLLTIGEVLAIPQKKHLKFVIKHNIKKGDTLVEIAKKYKISTNELKIANALTSSKIYVGQTLTIPQKIAINEKIKPIVKKAKIKKTPLKFVFEHKVTKGESLYSIAKKYNTTIEKIKVKNGLAKNTIFKGDILKIPQSIDISKKNKRFASIEPKKAFSLFKFFQSNSKGEKIVSLAKTKLGRKYVWGATGKKGTFDCSGFTQYLYKKEGINIPRTSRNQSKYGKFIARKDLEIGDLIFFDTSKTRRGYVNHVGIYIGDNKFIHASSGRKKVVITSLKKRFYSQRYKGARRPS